LNLSYEYFWKTNALPFYLKNHEKRQNLLEKKTDIKKNPNITGYRHDKAIDYHPPTTQHIFLALLPVSDLPSL
jgi:hypothetical protein